MTTTVGRRDEPAVRPPVAAVMPVPYLVSERRDETADTVTIELVNDAGPLPAPLPGQFAMLTAYGIGEVPISFSAVPRAGGDSRRLTLTLRTVGAVTSALYAARPGTPIGVRGPFGTGWDLAAARGRDVLVVGGGIGLAPLRPVVDTVLADRASFGDLSVLVGARTPGDLLYRDELRRWADVAQVDLIIDRAAPGWAGPVGLVTTLLGGAKVDPGTAVAFACGPEVMLRFVAQGLIGRGFEPSRIQVSMERTMRCGAAWCGHCQFGPLLICRDGPVVRYAEVEALLRVREL